MVKIIYYIAISVDKMSHMFGLIRTRRANRRGQNEVFGRKYTITWLLDVALSIARQGLPNPDCCALQSKMRTCKPKQCNHMHRHIYIWYTYIYIWYNRTVLLLLKLHFSSTSQGRSMPHNFHRKLSRFQYQLWLCPKIGLP